MRVLIIGDLRGQINAATNIACSRGADVLQVTDIENGLDTLRSGKGVELILIDIKQSIQTLVQQLKSEHIHIPVVGCGIDDSAQDAAQAIKSGAKEYLPLPPDEEMIAAILEAISEESEKLACTSPAMQKVIKIADQVASSEATILILSLIHI